MHRPILPALLIALAAAAPTSAQVVELTDSLEARVWLDRGPEAVLYRNDEVRVYYHTSHDAYLAIFRIDTDGVISMVFPHHPDMPAWVEGGRDHRLLFPEAPRWRVTDDPGVGYFFAVASPEPFDFSALVYDREYGWDLGAIGETVYDDPYVAIDEYVAAIVPDWEVVPYALDFLSYSVGGRHEYPRFLCYDCHGARDYYRWNPYDLQCSSYQVVIWDDPYFYPRYRYVGTRVVFARPPLPRPRYGVVVRTTTAWGPVVRSRPAPPRRVVEYKETPTRATVPARSPARAPRGEAARPRGSSASPAPSGRAVTAAPAARRPAGGSGPARGVEQPRSARGATPSRPTPSRGPAATQPTRRPTLRRLPARPQGREQAGPARSGSARAGSPSRAAPPDRRAPARATTVRPPTRARTVPTRSGSQPRAAPTRSSGSRPARAAPRSGASRPRATPSRPRATPSRPRPSGSSARRPPPKPRRPGGG